MAAWISCGHRLQNMPTVSPPALLPVSAVRLGLVTSHWTPRTHATRSCIIRPSKPIYKLSYFQRQKRKPFICHVLVSWSRNSTSLERLYWNVLVSYYLQCVVFVVCSSIMIPCPSLLPSTSGVGVTQHPASVQEGNTLSTPPNRNTFTIATCTILYQAWSNWFELNAIFLLGHYYTCRAWTVRGD